MYLYETDHPAAPNRKRQNPENAASPIIGKFLMDGMTHKDMPKKIKEYLDDFSEEVLTTGNYSDATPGTKEWVDNQINLTIQLTKAIPEEKQLDPLPTQSLEVEDPATIPNILQYPNAITIQFESSNDFAID